MMEKKRIFRVAFLLLPLLFFSLSSFGQALTVRGSVKSEKGEGLPGVTVVVKGTTTGSITDINGDYQVNVPSQEAILSYSCIGFETQEINVGTQTTINVIMKEETLGLKEIVVVGYGNQRREAVTGSVASIKGDVVRDIPASNITQALQGRVSGVEMSQTSTKPGAQMQIRIRGTRSLNANNDPLVVLDGIPFSGSIGDINLNDIKSIDILKDASATAIYGSRGANGVILVSTNKGAKGQKAQFSYNGYHGVQTIFAKYPMMNGPEYVALRKAAGKYSNTVDEADNVDTDWQDLLYRTGMVSSHDISVAGGTEKGNYKFGVGYYTEEAVVPLQDYTRYALSGSLDQEIGKLFRVGFTTNNSFSINNGNNLGAVGNALARSPIANPYKEDGTLKDIIQEQTSGAQWVSTRERLEGLGDKYIDQQKAFGSYNSIFAEVKIPGIEGLKYRVNLGLSFRMKNSGSYTGQGVFSGNPLTVSTASVGNELTTNWAVENMLTYDRKIGKHQFNVVGLYSAEESRFNSSSVNAKDIPADNLQFYNLGLANGEISVNRDYQGYSVSGLMSYMGRVMYSFNDRYMLSATFRSDGSSRLAKGHKWHTYPAVSAGWNLMKEAFMADVTKVDMLKLRVGYGQTSNQSVEPYKTLGLLSTRPYNFGNTYSPGFYMSELTNPDLGWEYSQTMNYGLDFGLFNNRLSGTVEYYVQKTNDVLLQVSLPSSNGVDKYMANIGKTENKGLELSLNGTILDNLNGWTWEAGVNLYVNRNKLTALASGAERDENNWWFVGHSINVIYDYEKIGLWQESDVNRQLFEPNVEAGEIRVKYTGEYNADGTPVRVINASDRQIMEIDPDFQGGFNTRVAYKGFDLSVIGSFKSGGTLISNLYGSGGYLNNLNTRSGNNVKVDYWTPENTGAKYPKPAGKLSSDNPKYASTLAYFDGSYMKIRTISLGYNFDQRWMKNLGITKLRLYATVQNPFVMFSPYKKESGMDPETNSYGNENAAVAYSNNLKRLLTIGTNTPTTRNYLFGMNLTF